MSHPEYMTGEQDPSPPTIAFVERITGQRAAVVDAKIDGLQGQINQAVIYHKDLVDEQLRRQSEANEALSRMTNVKFRALKDAASAAEKANGSALVKSEAATAEKIDKLEQLITGQVASLNEKVDDEKQALSVTRLEQSQAMAAFRQEMQTSLSAIRSELVAIGTRRIAVSEERVDHRSGTSLALVAVGTLIAVLVAAVTIYAALKP